MSEKSKYGPFQIANITHHCAMGGQIGKINLTVDLPGYQHQKLYIDCYAPHKTSSWMNFCYNINQVNLGNPPNTRVEHQCHSQGGLIDLMDLDTGGTCDNGYWIVAVWFEHRVHPMDPILYTLDTKPELMS